MTLSPKSKNNSPKPKRANANTSTSAKTKINIADLRRQIRELERTLENCLTEVSETNRLRLTLARRRDGCHRYIEWSIWRKRQHVAGGIGATKAHARIDAHLCARHSFQAGDHVNFRNNGHNEEVEIVAGVASNQGTCFSGRVIFRRIMPNGKLGPMRHTADPSKFFLL